MSTHQLVREKVQGYASGTPFTSKQFLEYGTRASVDKSLSRLVQEGSIVRVLHGVFVRPEINRFVGLVPPEPYKVAEAVVKSLGAEIQVHGAEAARRLELTTQVPTRVIYLTSGPSRSMRLGNMEIQLKRVSQRKLALSGRPAGLALTAMWYLGKTQVTPLLVRQIYHRIGAEEFNVLRSAAGSMPAWMSDVVIRCKPTITSE